MIIVVMKQKKIAVCITLAPSTIKLIRDYQSSQLQKDNDYSMSAVIDKIVAKTLAK